MTLPKTSAAVLALAGAVLVSALGSSTIAQTAPDEGERGPRLAEMFAAIDADQDGKVTQEELAAHRTAMFTAADSNGDGSLNADELAARQLARFNEQLQDRTARMIERMDDNGDGSLSPDEMGEDPMENRFARIDTDNDGAISEAEAEAAAERFAEHRGKRKHGMRDGWFN
jgi:Ca2+-binding EF-hand superfamily protein